MRNPISLARPADRDARAAPSAPLRSRRVLALSLVLAASHGAAAQPAPGTAPPTAPRQPLAPAPATGAAAPGTPAAPRPSPAAGTQAPVDAAQPAPGETDSLFELAQSLREGSESLTAGQAAVQAVRTAPSVRRAQAANERARAAASLALVAVYPRLELEARYTRLSERDDVISSSFGDTFTDLFAQLQELLGSDEPLPTVMSSLDLPLNQYQLQARLAFPLSDLFFQILPRYSASKRIAESQALTARAETETVALQAREAFYNYARGRAALLVARSALEQSEAQRRDVASLVSAGTLARVELMRADAQVATAQVALARAQGAVAVGRTVLRSLLHKPGEQDIAIDEALGQPMPALSQSKDQLLATALRRRPELQALRILTEAQDDNISADKADRLPKLSIGGAFDYANPNQSVNPYAEEWNESWTVFAALTWSPNDFAAAGARAGQTEAERTQTLADMQAFEDALRREVAQAYEDYQASRQAMEAALTGIRAAEESYRVRREQFRAGAAVATDVIDAEAELRRARLELINAAIDVRIARARLDRAVGLNEQA